MTVSTAGVTVSRTGWVRSVTGSVTVPTDRDDRVEDRLGHGAEDGRDGVEDRLGQLGDRLSDSPDDRDDGVEDAAERRR